MTNTQFFAIVAQNVAVLAFTGFLYWLTGSLWSMLALVLWTSYSSRTDA